MNYRTLSGVARALFTPSYYRAVFNIFRFFCRPWLVLYAYVTFSDRFFPRGIWVKTPTGTLTLDLYSPDDLVTAVECFAKLDYGVDRRIHTVVDMGANIGISAAYFLTRNVNVRAYLYEPVPMNNDRLRKNLRGLFRYSLNLFFEEIAVGVDNYQTTFDVEPTGRYGGLSKHWPIKIDVEVRSATEILNEVLDKEGYIDVLKLDIEGMEVAVLESLPQWILYKIGTIFAETHGDGPDLPGFVQSRRGSISTYKTSVRQEFKTPFAGWRDSVREYEGNED